MRKGLENVLLLLGYVFSLLLIVILIIAVTGAAPVEDLHSSFVKTLIYIASVGFLASAIGYCYLAFSAGKAVNEVLIYQSELSKTKVTRKVIKKLILQAVQNEQFTKVRRVKLIVIDNILHFTVYVELTESNVPYLIDYLKALISDMFDHTLKLTNYTTDFKVKKLSINYDVPREKILKEVEKQYQEECAKEQKTTAFSNAEQEKPISKTADAAAAAEDTQAAKQTAKPQTKKDSALTEKDETTEQATEESADEVFGADANEEIIVEAAETDAKAE